ncbi:MAG: DNA polymerase III subunit beta, partial [Polyangiaceae bacterium]
MKIVCDRVELTEALGLACTIVQPRSTKPVLQSIEIRAGKTGVEILATDLEVGVRVRVEKADVERDGQALLPAQKALSIVRELDGEKLEIACEDRVTTIKGPGARFRVVGEDPAEFPEVPDMNGEALHFGRTQLEAMIRKTAFSAAVESARYALNG